MNECEIYIQQVIETVLYFRELYEESNDGKTTAIEMLKPVKSITNVAVREFVLYELYRKQKLSLTEVAVQFARWPSHSAAYASFNLEDLEHELRKRCTEHERDIQFITDIESQTQRSFMRAARYIEQIANGNAPAHSRVVELFIPEAFVPRGFGKDNEGYREHVVPCAALRDESLARYKNGATVDQVADFLRRHVVIVEITTKQQKLLDGSTNGGGLGLKNTMPYGWQFDSGCIFQRLHDAEIAFDPPQELPTCAAKGCQSIQGFVSQSTGNGAREAYSKGI